MKRTAIAAGTAVLIALFVISTLRGIAVVGRNRLEQLHNAFLSLRVGQSTFTDALAIAQRYQPKVSIDSTGCYSSECTFSIEANNYFFNHDIYWKALRRIGIHPAGGFVQVVVQRGVVQQVHLRAYYLGNEDRWIHADRKIVNSFSDDDKCQHFSLKRHSTFAVSSGFATGYLGGAFISVASSADATIQKELGTIDYSCITRTSDCASAASFQSYVPTRFMPMAFEQLRDDRGWEYADNNAAEFHAWSAACFQRYHGAR